MITFAGILLLVSAPSGVRSAEPRLTVKVGEPFPNLDFPSLLNPSDYEKLGLGRTGGPLEINDIPATYLLIEFFNKSCRPCQIQVREVEAFYQSLVESGEIDRLRVLAVAVGNQAKYLPKYLRRRELSYPIAADPEFEQWRRLGEPGRTPFLVFLRRVDQRWIVNSYHFGIHHEEELNRHAEDLREGRRPLQFAERPWSGVDRHLDMPMSEEALRGLAAEVLTRVAGRPVEVERVEGEEEYLYRTSPVEGRGRLYARAATRAPVCEICHAVHFLYAFDEGGTLLAFEPIHVTKYGNVEWSRSDSAHFAERLEGRRMENLEFDPEVDTVSRATMSSALIFDEIRRTRIPGE